MNNAGKVKKGFSKVFTPQNSKQCRRTVKGLDDTDAVGDLEGFSGGGEADVGLLETIGAIDRNKQSKQKSQQDVQNEKK